MRLFLALLFVAAASHAAAQPTLTVLSSNATKALVEELGPQYEHDLVVGAARDKSILDQLLDRPADPALVEPQRCGQRCQRHRPTPFELGQHGALRGGPTHLRQQRPLSSHVHTGEVAEESGGLGRLVGRQRVGHAKQYVVLDNYRQRQQNGE